MRSLSYYLTLLVIKIKGVKSEFSRAPIDYKKLRNQDVHSPKIRGAQQFSINDCLITEIGSSPSFRGLIIYIHGGAFVYGPAKHHWDTANKLVEGTGCMLWMVDYPKAPENKISRISHNIDQVYSAAMRRMDKNKIILIGDSVGGTLAAALTQRIIKTNTPLPDQLILISPVMDSSFKNGAITTLESKDPMLSKKGVLSAKKMCAVYGNLEDPFISPINGVFEGFPTTILLIAENDITSPDQEILVTRLVAAAVDHKVIRGKGMPHIWPLLPVMREAKLAMKQIVEEINRVIA